MPDIDVMTGYACGTLLQNVGGPIADFQVSLPIEMEPSTVSLACYAMLVGLLGSTKSLRRVDLGRTLDECMTDSILELLCRLLTDAEVEELCLAESVVYYPEVVEAIANSPRLKTLIFWGSAIDTVDDGLKATFSAGGFAAVTHLGAPIPCLNALLRPYRTTFKNLRILEWGKNKDLVPSAEWYEICELLQLVGQGCPSLNVLSIETQVFGEAEPNPDGECVISPLTKCSRLRMLQIVVRIVTETGEAICPPTFNPSDDNWLQISKSCPELESLTYVVGGSQSERLRGENGHQPQPPATLRSLSHLIGNCKYLGSLQIPFTASGVDQITENELNLAEQRSRLKTLIVETAWQGDGATKVAECFDRLTWTSKAKLRWSDLLPGDHLREGDEAPPPLDAFEVAREEYWRMVTTMVTSLRDAPGRAGGLQSGHLAPGPAC